MCLEICMNIAVIIRAAQGIKQPYKKKRKPTFFFESRSMRRKEERTSLVGLPGFEPGTGRL